MQADRNEYHKTYPFTLPEVGSTIISPITGTAYVIGASLDQGNFGHVFHCSDEWNNELVAKVIKPLGAWQETEARTISETMAMVVARSPHIVHVHDTFVYHGAFIIVSERCSLSLRDMLQNPQLNPSIWFPALCKAVLNGLHWTHVNGFAHCDLHPGNVFLKFVPDALMPGDMSQRVIAFKVGDFGLARPIGAMEPSGTFLASIRPPEALDSSNFGMVDHRADIYQAGLLFLMFLTRSELNFSRAEILAGRPREMAESLTFPYAPALATMLRRRVEHRPRTALDAWRQFSGSLADH